MPCYHPIDGYRSRAGRNPKTGAWPVVFNQSLGYIDMPVRVPCGQCVGCRLERSRQWAVRCLHEASLHKNNCFVTLTYNNEHLDVNKSLNKRDITLFLKKLRKKYGSKIRYLQCGEYGSLTQRPHHHLIIFGFDFPDKYLWETRNGCRLYRSPSLEKLWTFGHSRVGGVTFESCAYVARYILKKITGQNAALHYLNRIPEYITMSRRPGIAREWFERYSSDVYPSDQCVIRPGVIARPPRYYDKRYDLQSPKMFAKIKVQRLKAARASVDNSLIRLADRERVQLAKLKALPRPLQ
ncbi:MAG: replication initiator protein [Microvirus sp.]|nr:MAG: replication initiator protein [Microvirus sp.]